MNTKDMAKDAYNIVLLLKEKGYSPKECIAILIIAAHSGAEILIEDNPKTKPLIITTIKDLLQSLERFEG